jgi:hypothetical protein
LAGCLAAIDTAGCRRQDAGRFTEPNSNLTNRGRNGRATESGRYGSALGEKHGSRFQRGCGPRAGTVAEAAKAEIPALKSTTRASLYISLTSSAALFKHDPSDRPLSPLRFAGSGTDVDVAGARADGEQFCVCQPGPWYSGSFEMISSLPPCICRVTPNRQYRRSYVIASIFARARRPTHGILRGSFPFCRISISRVTITHPHYGVQRTYHAARRQLRFRTGCSSQNLLPAGSMQCTSADWSGTSRIIVRLDGLRCLRRR